MRAEETTERQLGKAVDEGPGGGACCLPLVARDEAGGGAAIQRLEEQTPGRRLWVRHGAVHPGRAEEVGRLECKADVAAPHRGELLFGARCFGSASRTRIELRLHGVAKLRSSAEGDLAAEMVEVLEVTVGCVGGNARTTRSFTDRDGLGPALFGELQAHRDERLAKLTVMVGACDLVALGSSLCHGQGCRATC